MWKILRNVAGSKPNKDQDKPDAYIKVKIVPRGKHIQSRLENCWITVVLGNISVCLRRINYNPDGTYSNQWGLNGYMRHQAAAIVLAEERNLVQDCGKLRK